MKFFHVYNEECIRGLEKNGMLNQDSGFKIQHAFSVPDQYKFNKIAARGGTLYNLIKEGNMPFYVDRIAGGITYYPYAFDQNLIQTYIELLGDWFLGFQLHESGSNRRQSDWMRLISKTNGCKGPYEEKKLKELLKSTYDVSSDGIRLYTLSQDSPKQYASMRYAQTYAEYIEEMKDMFRRRMAEVADRILPCDSYYMATKLQDELGMRTFMPEVGCQIPMMRKAVALARGIAKASGKTWGTYYECWREAKEGEKYFYSMPCFNSDPSNEWYLTQETHPDDFTSYGENGGSSRLLQNRIYYYALMSGADYFSEEWGLNCSYTDMKKYTLSSYGKTKKDFIDRALTLQGIRAKIPFAIVLPKAYGCVELPYLHDNFEFCIEKYVVGRHRDQYLLSTLTREEQDYFGHVEDVLKLFFARKKAIGNEGHVITNSRFGDVFDILYEDASDKAFKAYEYLIDATADGNFAKAKAGSGLKILESKDLGRLEVEVTKLIQEVMPCYVDDLCWLVSEDSCGHRYLTVLNNEGNERSIQKGDIIHTEADTTAKIVLKEALEMSILVEGSKPVELVKVNDTTYRVAVPAAGFVILKVR